MNRLENQSAITSTRQALQSEIVLFLVLIPLINAYNYYLTYTNIRFGWFLISTYTIDTLTGYGVWWSIRSSILWLDQRLPYTARPLKRIAIQGLLTISIGLFIIIASTEILNALLKDKPVPMSFYQYDIFIFVIWFIGINGFYISFHYYSEWQRTEQLRTHDKTIRQEGIRVRSGRQELSVPFSEIKGVYVDGDYTVLVTEQSKKYLLDQSLDKVEQSIPSESFFRLNRQYILNRQAIEGFKRIENGKLSLILYNTDHFPDTLQVSRTKAPAFKAWFQLV
ncbi:hypothetical protein GO755_14840 [Spirosoma sp. HMF4905]|uniref:HTH LytTR-type domain-containing protein n=1 Tax=Spirosoma arboris TaxID=2682092 RepID=A0A7K1SCD1_9BACT|nr:LytTR family DNA-binding domain-containing protein [Spirosoma arboris]MVM31318.1 hypothetical protein [Spirosoma arboris]